MDEIYQKQEIWIGHVSNQNFVQIPMLIFADMLRYKLAEFGIRFVLTEESYTSSCTSKAGLSWYFYRSCYNMIYQK